MKKTVLLLMSLLLVSALVVGCGKTEGTDGENTNGVNRNISFSTNDLAIYTTEETDGIIMPSKFITMIGVDPSTVEPSDDEKLELVKQFIETDEMEISEGDIDNPGAKKTRNVIRYFKYTGSREPIINSKNITTTGMMPEDDNCSSVDDVIEAYGIDKENEEYIENEDENGSYVIKLNFKDLDTKEGTLERIITPKGSEAEESEVRYTLRFTIQNDHVHGIDAYMYF